MLIWLSTAVTPATFQMTSTAASISIQRGRIPHSVTLPSSASTWIQSASNSLLSFRAASILVWTSEDVTWGFKVIRLLTPFTPSRPSTRQYVSWRDNCHSTTPSSVIQPPSTRSSTVFFGKVALHSRARRAALAGPP
jgi:hypothetical protein